MKFMIEEHEHNKEELKRTHAQRIKEVSVKFSTFNDKTKR